jgi:DNA-binding GntR family transcriptional regulator
MEAIMRKKPMLGRSARKEEDLLKGTGSQQAYATLRRKILRLELRPGSSLDETTLVEMLGISRTPVREALIRLSTESLVVLLPNRSAHVAPLDLERVREFFEAVDVLQRTVNYWAAVRRSTSDLDRLRSEMLAFEHAAARRNADDMIETNRQFHASVAAACKNLYISEGYCRLLTQALRISRLVFTYDFAYDEDGSLSGHIERVINEHRLMVEAIKEQDSATAERLGSAHARLALSRLNHMMSAGLRGAMEIPIYHDLNSTPSVLLSNKMEPARQSKQSTTRHLVRTRR